MNRVASSATAAALGLAAAAISLHAAQARPSMSRGEQFVNMSESQCEDRGHVAFANAGWTDIAGTATWVKAHKGAFTSYITCNSVGGGQVVVNIFVAYDGSDPDGSLAGHEREQLQTEMAR